MQEESLESKIALRDKRAADVFWWTLMAMRAVIPLYVILAYPVCCQYDESVINLPEWTPAAFQQRFPIFSGFFPMMPPALPIWNACAGLMGSHVQNVKSSMSPIDLRREPPLS
jgi:hypothetical protein